MWECKECGQENDDSFPNCMSCGLESDVTPPQPDPPVQVDAPTKPAGPWDLTRTIARIISFVGWLVVGLGFAVPLIIFLAAETGRATRGEILGEFLGAVLAPMLSISLSGLFLVLIGHVARAIVKTTENSGRILEILESECGNPPDRAA